MEGLRQEIDLRAGVEVALEIRVDNIEAMETAVAANCDSSFVSHLRFFVDFDVDDLFFLSLARPVSEQIPSENSRFQYPQSKRRI